MEKRVVIRPEDVDPEAAAAMEALALGSRPSEPRLSEPEPPKTLFGKLKKWGALVAVLIGLGSAGGTVWRTIVYIDDLHDTIGANKIEVSAIRGQLNADHEELTENISTIAAAMVAQRDRDRDVITNLRIAVAALQAGQAVRDGRGSYAGVDSLGAPPGTNARPVPPSARRAQAELAEHDAAEALQRAERIQANADEEDPFAGLDGL